MKKQYIKPQANLNEYIDPLMESIGVGSTPDNEGDILGKDRKDDFVDDDSKSDSWTNGLW